ncbi:MAG: TolC family protein [Flavobacteriaceae bacterium]
MSKQEALNLTLENNYDIIISRNTVEQADNSQSVLNSGYLPSVTASGRETYNYAKDRTGSISNVSLGINYVLFNGLNRKNTFKRLKEAYNVSETAARQIVENTILTLFTAYYEVARLEENERNQSQALKISKDRLLRAEYGFDFGQQTKLDVLNAEVDVNNDSINYLEITRQLANAKRDLNVIIGREVDIEVKADTSVLYLKDLRLDSLMVQAKRSNTGLLQAESQIKLGNYDVKINQSGWMPTVSLTSSYAWSQSSFQNIPNQVIGGLNAGVNLSWNIFDGGRTSTNVQNARISVETAKVQKMQVEEQLRRDVYNAWETYQNLMFTYQVQQKNVETNLRNFQRTNEGYKLGQISSIDFRLAQVNLLNATLALSGAKYNAKNAELRLLQLSGLLIDNTVF